MKYENTIISSLYCHILYNYIKFISIGKFYKKINFGIMFKKINISNQK